MLFLTTKFIKIAFRAPSLKSKCQTLGVTISWLVGAGVWGIYTWVLSNWLGKLNAWQDFLIMGPTCPAWTLGLAGYCWALSPMGIFSPFLLKKVVAPSLSLPLLLLLFRWCFSILISWCRGWGIYIWVEFWWNDINIYLIYISIKLLARSSYQGDVAGAIYHTWRRIGKFDYPYFFCHTAAATSTLLVVEKARVSGEDHKSLATLSCAWEVGNPGSCERQQAVSVQPYYEAT